MRFATMALRNLARNRRRTAISLGIVAAGTVGLLLTAGFIRFSFDGLREALIHGGLGHLEVVPAAAQRSSTLERSLGSPSQGLADWVGLQAELEKVPGVLAAGPNLHLMGMANRPGGGAVSFIGLGVDPERERRMGFEVKLRQGQELPAGEPAAGADAVLLALGLAESLEVGPGDVVTLLAMTPDQMLNALDVRVAGVVTTGVQDLDTRYLKLHVVSAQRLLGTDRVSNLILGLGDTTQTAAVRDDIVRRFSDYEPALAVIGWEARAPFYTQVKNLYGGIFWFLGSVIFVLVVLATSNTLIMSVLERVREIGTLRALGTGRGQVARLVFWEAIWLGLFGGLLGNLGGVLLIYAINAAKLQMPPPPGAVNGIDLQLAVVPEAMGGSLALMVVVLALAAVAPIWKATRLRIVEALGHV